MIWGWPGISRPIPGWACKPRPWSSTGYFTGAWSTAWALDAKTGELLWKFDPEVPREKSISACCGVVNRGMAAWEDALFLGTIDGRLIALDRDTGEQLWSQQTTDPEQPYSITGAPRACYSSGGSRHPRLRKCL